MNLGTAELLILAIIVVVVFGGGAWLPKAARNLGRAKVEMDNVQKQVAETKAQVVEATGLDKADQALRKANRALNQSPQSMMRNAAKSAITPSAAAAAAASEAGDDEIEDAINIEADEAAQAETLNVDFGETT